MLAQVFDDSSLSAEQIKYNLAKVFMQFIEPKKQREILSEFSVAKEYSKQEQATQLRSLLPENKKRDKSRAWD